MLQIKESNSTKQRSKLLIPENMVYKLSETTKNDTDLLENKEGKTYHIFPSFGVP